MLESSSPPIDPRALLETAASREGLLLIGIVALEYPEAYHRFNDWLSDGRHGEMRYLENHRDLRAEPASLLPGARVAIIVAMPYDLGDSRRAYDSPRVAQYARLPDYHRVLRRKSERIAQKLTEVDSSSKTRVIVDSAPVLEKALAASAALGFIGKNTCFIHPKHGSFLLLAEILTTTHFSVDTKRPVGIERKTKSGGCGPCRLCQTACPTGALNKDYSIDARLCLSYWTIEHRGPIPERFWPHLNQYYFGCDLCQLACPYNRSAQPLPLPEDVSERAMPSLFETAVMNQAEYESHFGGTSLTRAKRNGLRRNALIAMAVTRDPLLPEAMVAAEKDDGSPVGETLEQLRKFLLEHR